MKVFTPFTLECKIPYSPLPCSLLFKEGYNAAII
jgi:hypothetical protein